MTNTEDGFEEPMSSDIYIAPKKPIILKTSGKVKKFRPIPSLYTKCDKPIKEVVVNKDMFIINSDVPAWANRGGINFPTSRPRPDESYEAPEGYYCFKTTGGMPLFFKLPVPPPVSRTKLQRWVLDPMEILCINIHLLLIELLNSTGKITKKSWTVVKNPIKLFSRKK